MSILKRLIRGGSSTNGASPNKNAASGAPPSDAPSSAPRPLNLGVPEPDARRALVIYKFDSCPYCQRVMRRADALGVELEYRDTRQDREAWQALRDRTGRTQVPCMFVDDQPLFESADISRWLERYADNGFAG